MPTVWHDHHGDLGLIWRVAGLQQDCFKVKASCRERTGVSRTALHMDFPTDTSSRVQAWGSTRPHTR